jgi:hypothetical protein
MSGTEARPPLFAGRLAHLPPNNNGGKGGARVTISMRLMGVGDGVKYLLTTVVAEDGDRSFSTPQTKYYSGAGIASRRMPGARRVDALDE